MQRNYFCHFLREWDDFYKPRKTVLLCKMKRFVSFPANTGAPKRNGWSRFGPPSDSLIHFHASHAVVGTLTFF